MTSIATDAHIRAEQAEAEASELRLEIMAAHQSIIAIKRVGRDKAIADFNFYTMRLHALGDFTDEDVAEDKAHVDGLGPIIEKDVANFRARWGRDPK